MSVTLSVSQLNLYVKSIIDGDFNLSDIFITGEISNFTNHYRTGHLYFSLKDENAAVKAVMFRSAASRLKFLPENGMRVVVRGRVGVYERDGVYQVYAEDMQPDGAGALAVAFEQLKKKLEDRGWFDDRYKKKLSVYPERIAVITSPTGAAVRDIINVLGRRFPYAAVKIVPVQVQGDSAPGQLVQALREVNAEASADVIIIGRGGGSIEDLWAFNTEQVAEAIFKSDIPVISAVGHETDFTISDFVADLRAPTPSAAAELAVPDTNSLLTYIDSLMSGAQRAVKNTVFEFENTVLNLQRKLADFDTSKRLAELEKRIGLLSVSASTAFEKTVSRECERLSVLCARAGALDPMKIVSRGFSVVRTEDGRLIKSTRDVTAGQKALITVSDGELCCTIERIDVNG